VAGVGNWAAIRKDFDPNTAAQNKRLSFQRDAGEAGDPAAGMSADESAASARVLDFLHDVAPGHGNLLYIGNSQTMAIMDRQPGDLVTAQWVQLMLNRSNPPRPIDVRLGSMPNLTPTEGLVRLVLAAEAAPPRVGALLCCEVLEEFRGLSIRDELGASLTPEIRATLERIVKENPDLPDAGRVLRSDLSASAAKANAGDRPIASETVARRLDRVADDAAKTIPMFRERPTLKAVLGTWIYLWRNQALGITSATPRPVPESSYQASLQMVELTIRYARSRGITVYAYLTPLRPITPNPNVPSEVKRFRQDVPALFARYGSTCLDYTDLVPESLWTKYGVEDTAHAGDLDFAHFTGGGHKLVAETLMRDIGTRLLTTPPAGSTSNAPAAAAAGTDGGTR
jgi:hypothetical protein